MTSFAFIITLVSELVELALAFLAFLADLCSLSSEMVRIALRDFMTTFFGNVCYNVVLSLVFDARLDFFVWRDIVWCNCCCNLFEKRSSLARTYLRTITENNFL